MTGSVTVTLEALARRDKAIVFVAVGAVVTMAGLYTIFGFGMQMSALKMTEMAGQIGRPMSMGLSPIWTAQYAILIFFMWWIMMIAMMTPSAAPTLLLFLAVKKKSGNAAALGTLFLLGYLVAWAGFSLVATSLQYALESLGSVNGSMMTLSSRTFAGIVLLAAGAYQFSPLKNACLDHCRAPVHFLTTHHRPGPTGALVMGMHHGAYCLGCCWALMALLFVGGIMNLYWIVGIALYVAAEKLITDTRRLTYASGAVLLLWGGWLIVTAQ